MKRKNILSLILAISISLCSIFNVSALSNEETLTNEQVDKILLDFGYDKDIIDIMTGKQELAEMILSEPESVTMNSSVSEFNELQYLEFIVNNTDDELIDYGMKQEEVEKNRALIEDLRNTSNGDLSKKLHRSNVDIKLVKMAIEPNDEYSNEYILNNNISTSGTIGTNKLTFVMTAIKNSRNTGKALSYRVEADYKWNSWPIMMEMDQIAFAWGGDLATLGWSSTIHMQDMVFHNNYKLRQAYRVDENPINTGLKFQIKTWESCSNIGHMLLAGGDCCRFAEKGSVFFTLYQNSADRNRPTKISAYYGHKVLVVSSAGITISDSGLSFGINLGWGFDYSHQQLVSITY